MEKGARISFRAALGRVQVGTIERNILYSCRIEVKDKRVVATFNMNLKKSKSENNEILKA